MISSGLGIAVVVDTVLAAVLIYVLHTSRTGVKKSVNVPFRVLCVPLTVPCDRTNSLLDTLIAYTVCTGMYLWPASHRSALMMGCRPPHRVSAADCDTMFQDQGLITITAAYSTSSGLSS